ncbi:MULTISPECIES: hypothetical protein [Actinomycetes]|uniref:Uncharacterized protein n=1 Tax=Amycolatopsis deserti TaxID=185696 RepID=A0ABQ3JL30_9PSEU|nr:MULTISPECIES: hypothetical protein [Actinomycetes]GHF30903.1 hypothetical protein GCM10017786_76020 [Amycolatopsis deserti]
MSHADDDDQRTPADPPAGDQRAGARPGLRFTWTRTGVDENGRPVDLCYGTTDDHRVVVEVGDRVVYFDEADAVDVSAGLRLAIGKLSPEDRWWS